MTQDELDRTVSRNYVTGLERRCNELGYDTTANATVIRALQDTLKREKARADDLQSQCATSRSIVDEQGKKIEKLMRQVARLKKKEKSKR